MSPTASLIDHVWRLRFESLNADTLSHCKTFIADSLGVAIAGHRGEFSAGLFRAVQDLGHGEDARIWGSTQRLPAANAAMVNAYLIHCLEFDCVHEAAVVHPMAVILATLLAECERRPELSGRDLMLGVIVAVDVAATLGMASQAKLRFFRPAQCGAFGAAAALAKLAGMDGDGIANVLGVLLGQISGTMQAHREGVALLPMQIAFNARNAITAFDFARAGLQGPRDMWEGEFGYLALFEGVTDLRASVASLLENAAQGIHAISQVSHKPFPSGRATHGGIDALQALLQQHQLAADEIATVQLFAPPLIRQLVDRPAIAEKGANYLRLCFAYCAARVLSHGGLHVDDFSASAIADASTFDLAKKITVHSDENLNPNALGPIRLLITSVSGVAYERTVHDVLGSPNNRLSESAHLAKLERNLSLFLPAGAKQLAQQVSQSVADLNHSQSARNLLDCLPIISATPQEAAPIHE